MSEKKREVQIPPDSRFGHKGELKMRDRLPSPIYRWDEQTLRGMIHEVIPLGMARFIEAQQFFIIATADDEGQCDAGFRSAVRDSQEDELMSPCRVVENGRVLLFPDYSGDALCNNLGNIRKNPHIGMIFIDFTRIGRVRVNGMAFLEEANEDTRRIWPGARAYVRVVVEQAYGNCPARIPRLVPIELTSIPQQIDELEVRNRFSSSEDMIQGSISLELAKFIEAQQFFFIATADAEGHCDASFRGAEANHETGEMLPSCQVIDNGRVLVFPDYSGNALYNSLGNILVNPHVGMVFIDFSRTSGVRVSGGVSIEEVNEDIKKIWPNAQAYLRVVVERVNGNCPARIPKLVSM